ncbi:MAG TPA: hypothetical protein DEQ43_19255 [Nocardioides bacterium]|nr:hypothetical protein [Nocardioides sp.]
MAAAGLVGLEGLTLAILGVLELASLNSARVALALTTALFFVGLGAGLGWCARGLFLVRSWARGPVVACQLIGVLLGFSFWGGETTPIAVGILLVCVAALIGVLHPASTRALAADEG